MADIEYPKNININGLMSFPLYTQQNLQDVVKWRADKGIAKPKYDDRIGLSLMLTQTQHDKIVANLRDVYLPFAANLQKLSEKKKGIDPKLVGKLAKLVEEEDWSEANLPIRDLTDSDVKNLEKNNIEGIVSKIRLSGPTEDKPIIIKALVREDHDDPSSEMEVVSIDSIADRLGEQTDVDRLWWGASWPFRTNVRFNAFNAASFGVSAYIRTVYLLADRELKMFGGQSDADVVADGDDWE